MKASSISEVVSDIKESLSANKLVRCHLPDGSRLHIDRQLPFLCVYRRPIDREDSGTERLLLGEAAYLIATSRERHYSDYIDLINKISRAQSQCFGSFLLIELWSSEADVDDTTPAFHIYAPRKSVLQGTLESLESELLSISIENQQSKVELSYKDRIHPPGLKPLLTEESNKYFSLGIEVKAIYRNRHSGEVFPFELRELHNAFAKALKRTLYIFTHSHTTQRPAHFHELGRHAMTRAVYETDKRLEAISQRFDLLLHVTPVNVPEASSKFHSSNAKCLPEFLYRPRPVDPALMKRELFNISIENIEDPTLAYIYENKQNELDRQITLVSDRNTPRFLSGCRQLYGEVEPELLGLAEDILQHIPEQLIQKQDDTFYSAVQFAEIARDEINYYRNIAADFSSSVEVRDDISGILVSKGNFLIGSDAKISRSRLAATLAHEISIHLITYYNGKQQPLTQFYTGMAGYEPMQEGLAVLAEYLVGELSTSRLRLLAGRVLAVQSIYQGADFIETFRILHEQYGFSSATAFTITMRVYRGGGYTKDVVYLRGLMNLLSYLADGGDLELLFLGKISYEHISLIHELQWRKVLTPAILRPRFLDDAAAIRKISQLRKGITVLELISGET